MTNISDDSSLESLKINDPDFDERLSDIMFEMLQDFERVHEEHIDIGEFAIRSAEKIVGFAEMYKRAKIRAEDLRREIEAKLFN